MRTGTVWGAGLLGIAVLAGASRAHGQGVTQQDVARLEEYMAARSKYRHFSGAVLVARDGKVLLSKGYGLANREWNAPCTPVTKFRVGSLTKLFTATAVMLLAERGKLDVQVPVRTYLPDCPAAWDSVTIHRLLTHTSGIPDLVRLRNSIKNSPGT